MMVLKCITGVPAAIAFVILLFLFPLWVRAVAARATGRIPPERLMVNVPGEGATDAVRWFIRCYVGAAFAALTVGWFALSVFLPAKLACPFVGHPAGYVFVIVLTIIAVFGTLFAMAVCASVDVFLKEHDT